MSDKSQSEEKNAMDKSLRPDQPIRSSEEDLLARAHLADAIGECILATGKPESIVIAINAPWGAGKSSFLNLLERRLKSPKKDEVKPILIPFNPWLYNSVEQLIEMSFDELGQEIGKGKKTKKIFGWLLYCLGALSSMLGDILSNYLSVAGSAMKTWGEKLKKKKPLLKRKKNLDKILQQLNQRIVIFIDDIDRLERDNLRLLFRAIRLCADFKNVTYVLAFDKLVVEKHLAENDHISEHDYSGRAYLEKIVQVSFDLPEPAPNELARFCFKEIKDVLSSLSTRPVDEGRLHSVFDSLGFKEHFRTIRQIKRYINGLKLTLAPVAAEVDLVDFVAIDFLRTFHLKIYSEIAQRQGMLVPEDGNTQLSANRFGEWVEDLLKALPPDSREYVQRLLSALANYTDSASLEHSIADAFSEERRVLSPAAFDKFFRLATPSNQISEVEMDQFIENLEDEDATFQFIKQAFSDGKTENLLTRLGILSRSGRLREECVVPLTKVMFRCIDNPDIEEEQASDYDINSEFVSIIYYILLRIESEDKRHELILELIQESPVLYAIVKLVSFFRKLKDRGVFPMYDDYWNTIQERTVKRIRVANHDGSLWGISGFKPHDILIGWVKLASEDEVYSDIISWLNGEKDDGKFIVFLIGFPRYLHCRPDRPRFEKLSANNEIKERLMRIKENNEEYAALANEIIRYFRYDR